MNLSSLRDMIPTYCVDDVIQNPSLDDACEAS